MGLYLEGLDDSEDNNDDVRIWPWPLDYPWSEKKVLIEIVRVLEGIKDERYDDANRALDSLGPHLYQLHHMDVFYHVAIALHALERHVELKEMVEKASKRHHRHDGVVAAKLLSEKEKANSQNHRFPSTRIT